MKKFILKVCESCKTFDQRLVCKQWVDRIVKEVEFAEKCYLVLGFRYE